MKPKEYILSSIFIILCLFGFSSQRAGAININVTGTWSELIDGMDLQGPPGSDLNNTYESSANAVTVSITGPSGIWIVYIRKSDIQWPASFTLYARRTSSGSGFGLIFGGTTYQLVTNTDSSFFWGIGNRQSVNIQYRLEGVSAQIPLGNYLTTILYTATD